MFWHLLPGPVTGGVYRGMGRQESRLWRGNRKMLAKRSNRCEGQIHERICRATILCLSWRTSSIWTTQLSKSGVVVCHCSDGQKKKVNKIIGWVQGSLRASGSTPKPMCATDRATCKTSGSSN